jgi:hypothetical protein
MREAGFRADLVDNAIDVVGNTIAELMSSFAQLSQIQVIEGYGDCGDWKFLDLDHSDRI